MLQPCLDCRGELPRELGHVDILGGDRDLLFVIGVVRQDLLEIGDALEFREVVPFVGVCKLGPPAVRTPLYAPDSFFCIRQKPLT